VAVCPKYIAVSLAPARMGRLATALGLRQIVLCSTSVALDKPPDLWYNVFIK